VSDAADTLPSRLASARAARGLSVAQAAGQMRIAPEAVAAMEEGRFADLGPAVFARGHLRKYAALLGVPVEEVLAEYDASPSRAAESTLIPPASAHTPVRGDGGPKFALAAAVVAMLVVLAAAAAGGWWYWQSRAATPPSAEAGVATEVAPVAAPEIGEASPEAAAGSDAPLPVTDLSGRLALEFSGPCWLEVYDADGRRLAFQLAEAGSVLTFDGPPPWRLVLGNADFVRVALDGNAVEIPATMKVRDAALVTVAGDGTVAPAPAEEGAP